MRNNEYYTINKMIEYIDKVISYTNNYDFESFSKDNKTVDATIFAISQIGELVKNIDSKFQDKNSEIEWNILKGLRNRIVHDYEGINLELIWDILQNDILQLKDKLLKIV